VKNRVSELLQERGLSVYRFWKDSGIARNTAYRLASDPDHYPEKSVLHAICQTLGVTPGEVLIYTPENQGDEECVDTPPAPPSASSSQHS
jgi:DNA-binding Xre family transcriptional regulator